MAREYSPQELRCSDLEQPAQTPRLDTLQPWEYQAIRLLLICGIAVILGSGLWQLLSVQ